MVIEGLAGRAGELIGDLGRGTWTRPSWARASRVHDASRLVPSGGVGGSVNNCHSVGGGVGGEYAGDGVESNPGGGVGGQPRGASAWGEVYPDAPICGAADPPSLEHRLKLELRMRAVVWAEPASRKHWLVGGRPPAATGTTAAELQGILREVVSVSPKLPLNFALAAFGVTACVPRGAGGVPAAGGIPLPYRLGLVEQALVQLLGAGLAPAQPEEDIYWFHRDQALQLAFDSAAAEFHKYHNTHFGLMTQPAATSTTAAIINKDLGTWSDDIA